MRRPPDESMILQFQHLPKKYHSADVSFAKLHVALQRCGLMI